MDILHTGHLGKFSRYLIWQDKKMSERERPFFQQTLVKCLWNQLVIICRDSQKTASSFCSSDRPTNHFSQCADIKSSLLPSPSHMLLPWRSFFVTHWCYLAGPGEPPNLDQPFHPNFKPRPTTRRSPARSRKQCLQRYQRRWSTSHFPSGFTGDEDENHGHSAMLFCEGIHVATFFQISWIFTSGTFWTWELLPLCPCCRLPHRPLKPKSSNFRSLSFLQIMQIITKKGAVNFWTLSETWQPYTLATSYILPHDGVLPDPKRTETLTQGVWCRWWERLEVRCANLQSQCPWPQQTRHPIHSHPFRSHQLRVQQVPSSCFQPAPSMGLWPWGRKEESPDATFLHSSDASRPPQVESVQSPAPAPAREETARQWS